MMKSFRRPKYSDRARLTHTRPIIAAEGDRQGASHVMALTVGRMLGKVDNSTTAREALYEWTLPGAVISGRNSSSGFLLKVFIVEEELSTRHRLPLP